jgi:CheY-like chemotaxis protein
MLRAAHYDALTLDLLMPGMDGLAVLEQIRADPDLRAMPVVFVSVVSGRRELVGEWVVSKPIDADELRHVLGAAVKAARSRVLVVGRPQLQSVLERSLEDLGIEHQWALSSAAAARACSERRYEVALVDLGVRHPHAVLHAIDLRGRRAQRAAILFSDGRTPTPPAISRMGIDVIPIDNAATAVLAALHGERNEE